MPDMQISDAVAESITIWSVVAQLTFDEFLLAIICVLPLLLVLDPLTAWLSGRDREVRVRKREVRGESWRSSAEISPRVAQLEARAEASARRLERTEATDEAAFEALHQDIAGIAWELMKLRSELGAEDTRATQQRERCRRGLLRLDSPPPPAPAPRPLLPPPRLVALKPPPRAHDRSSAPPRQLRVRWRGGGRAGAGEVARPWPPSQHGDTTTWQNMGIGILPSGHVGAIRGGAVQRQQHAQPVGAYACARRAGTRRADTRRAAARRADALAEGAEHGAAQRGAQAATPAEPVGGGDRRRVCQQLVGRVSAWRAVR